MHIHNHYFYDKESCEFIPIEYNIYQQGVYNLSIWILTGITLASIGMIILSNFVGTPSELALSTENKILLERLEETKQSLTSLEQQLQELSQRDAEIYRSILGLDKEMDEEALLGVGGSNLYENYEIYSENAFEILSWTSQKIDELERQVNVQDLSLEEIKAQYNENRVALKNIPAIKPGSGILLSGFGMRRHPVLGYVRPHDGLDFRADIGSDVYATGDGEVIFAKRYGTFGRTLIIDHGFGYKTLYAHLSVYEDDIKVGAKVKRGQVIAKSGNTGLTEGPHLHYEVHFNDKPVDPLLYLFADISPEEYLLFKQIAESNNKSY
jgi:murein DD-endopeptidase MepM/ murein hydrolase activator NlpD